MGSSNETAKFRSNWWMFYRDAKKDSDLIDEPHIGRTKLRPIIMRLMFSNPDLDEDEGS